MHGKRCCRRVARERLRPRVRNRGRRGADDLLEENGFNNSRLFAAVSDEHYTYPSTLYPSDEKADKRIIDYCFVKGNVLVGKYSVDAELPDLFTEVSGLGNDASDHYPIVCETVLYNDF